MRNRTVLRSVCSITSTKSVSLIPYNDVTFVFPKREPWKSASFRFAPRRSALTRSAFPRSVPLRSAFLRLAPQRLALPRFAPHRIASLREACPRSAFHKSTLPRLATLRSALFRFVLLRSAPLKSDSLRFAPDKLKPLRLSCFWLENKSCKIILVVLSALKFIFERSGVKLLALRRSFQASRPSANHFICKELPMLSPNSSRSGPR